MKNLTKLSLLLALGMAGPAFGLGTKADIKSNGIETTLRGSLSGKNAVITCMAINNNKDNALKQSTLRADLNKSLLGGTGYLIARVNDKQGIIDYMVSPGFGKGAIYTEPIGTNLDQNGKVTAVAPFIQYNNKHLGFDIQAAGLDVMFPQDIPMHAIYATAQNSKIGFGISKACDNSPGVQLGTKGIVLGDTIGTASNYSWNNETKSWNLTTRIAENPMSNTGPNFPKLWDDYIVIGRPTENMPYFTGTATITRQGLAGSLSLSGKGNDLTSVSGDIGFNAGNGYGISVSEVYSPKTNKSVQGATVTYKSGGITIEGKLNTEKSGGLYVGFGR